LSGTAKAVAQATPIAAASRSESISKQVGAQQVRSQDAGGKDVRARARNVPSGTYSDSRSGAGGKANQNGASSAAAQSNAGAWLIASGSAPRFGLVQSRTIIGRALGGEEPDIDLGALKAIADRVSRRHAEIIKNGADYFIRDLGSLNGTYITGRGRLGRDQLYKLKDRDQVVFGSAKLEFRKG
jgi:pSer/pThr/pTyr-binding forkhead associated (FHA) protein